MKLSTAIKKGYTTLRKAKFTVKQGFGKIAEFRNVLNVCALGCARVGASDLSYS